jgi:hypothetical protein
MDPLVGRDLVGRDGRRAGAREQQGRAKLRITDGFERVHLYRQPTRD